MTMMPHPVSDVDVAFPCSVAGLLPKWEEIPDEFKRGRTPWNRIFSEWFYSGLKDQPFTPKEGIDQREALRHVAVCMGSFEPAHEHKEAGVSYLLSQWFDLRPPGGGGK